LDAKEDNDVRELITSSSGGGVPTAADVGVFAPRSTLAAVPAMAFAAAAMTPELPGTVATAEEDEDEVEVVYTNRSEAAIIKEEAMKNKPVVAEEDDDDLDIDDI